MSDVTHTDLAMMQARLEERMNGVVDRLDTLSGDVKMLTAAHNVNTGKRTIMAAALTGVAGGVGAAVHWLLNGGAQHP